MLYRLRQRLGNEGGFTLIELLVVILIIGILAAIAIPSFLNQKGKANDASAKELARTAQTTAETYSTENNGIYTGLTVAKLNELEKTIPIKEGNDAWISAVTVEEGGKGYSVTATAPSTKDTFTIAIKEGEVTRSCKGKGGGCPSTEKW
jgi:prepilin-type N-terminal cleavage/methylation domain-containing protein